MEFKLYSSSGIVSNNSILIESQWNLNSSWREDLVATATILIESQWNLNLSTDLLIYRSICHINRITVEFK